MPVMGPDYNRDKADEAVQEVLKLLKEKYNIRRHDPIYFVESAMRNREEDNQNLKDVIHSLFKHDAYEGF